MAQVAEPTPVVAGATKVAVVDTDVHNMAFPGLPEIKSHLPQRWREHMDYLGVPMGLRLQSYGGERPRQRQFAHRTDATPPSGAIPGNDPDFARLQVLDEFDMSGAIMNDIVGFMAAGERSYPRELAIALSRAFNDYRLETWLQHDPRWYGSITLSHEIPDEAVAEIVRCKEGPLGSRWVQVLLPPDNSLPAGNPKYWPIYEACEQYGIPIAFHVLANRRQTSIGSTNYYFEEHCDFAQYNFPLVSSLVFEGVFDRFPGLKVAMIELAWSWAVPFCWRMDAAHRKLRGEVPHLERTPSEYVREHFWFSTQPMEETESPEWFDDVWGLFESFGMGDRLMWSSDYPHWDGDDPFSLPETLSVEARRRILGENASKLYGIELLPDSGVDLAQAFS